MNNNNSGENMNTSGNPDSGASTPNLQNRQMPQRPVSIQPSQVNQLAQALRNEVSLAKAAGNDIAKAQQHYAKAESIKQVLLNYRDQQNARKAQQQQQQQQQQPLGTSNQVNQPASAGITPINRQSSPQATPQGQSPVLNQSQPIHQSPANSASPAPSIPANNNNNNAATIEKFNQAKARLAEFERKIQQLQNSKKSYNLNPEQVTSIESQLTELKSKYAQYQRYAIYIKSQLVEQAKSNITSAPGMSNAPTPGTIANQRVPLIGNSAPQGISSPSMPKQGSLPPDVGNLSNKQASVSAKGKSVSPPPTNVNATPSKSGPGLQSSSHGVPPINLSGITKPSVPSIPISGSINVKPPTAVTLKPTSNNNRATLSSGVANGIGQILGTPAILKLPTYDLSSSGAGGAIPDNGGRVLTKRKLSELVNNIGADEGDGKTNIDGDVEELLLDLADEFITSVTGFACRLAKHRKVDSVDVRDVQLHLERNWNIRIPGYAMDEIRTTRKWQPNPSYNQKVSGVEISKSVNGNIN